MASSATSLAQARGSGVSTEALRLALLEAAIDAVVVAGEDGRIVEWNDAATTTFGLSRADVIGRPFDETIIPERRVSVNLSASSINDRRLVHMIETEMRAMALDPDLLIFEITETVATPAIESLREFATRIERLGCNLALDDAGTGFGSLTYLRHLPFSFLKIDAEFVRGLTESDADARIVSSLVAIARGFGMRTVAEGIENEDVLGRLGDFGIDYAQGYHLGRPAPA